MPWGRNRELGSGTFLPYSLCPPGAPRSPTDGTDGLGVGSRHRRGRQPELRASLPPRCRLPEGARDEGCLATARWTPGGYARSPGPAAEAHSPSTSPAPGPAGRGRPGAGRRGRMPGAAGPWRAAGASRLAGDADPGPPSVCGSQCARPPFKPSAMTNPRPARNPCSQSQVAWHFGGGHDLPASPPPQARGDSDVSKSGREVGARSS